MDRVLNFAENDLFIKLHVAKIWSPHKNTYMYNLYFCETFSDILFSESSLPTKTDKYNSRPQVMHLQYIVYS